MNKQSVITNEQGTKNRRKRVVITLTAFLFALMSLYAYTASRPIKAGFVNEPPASETPTIAYNTGFSSDITSSVDLSVSLTEGISKAVILTEKNYSKKSTPAMLIDSDDDVLSVRTGDLSSNDSKDSQYIEMVLYPKKAGTSKISVMCEDSSGKSVQKDIKVTVKANTDNSETSENGCYTYGNRNVPGIWNIGNKKYVIEQKVNSEYVAFDKDTGIPTNTTEPKFIGYRRELNYSTTNAQWVILDKSQDAFIQDADKINNWIEYAQRSSDRMLTIAFMSNSNYDVYWQEAGGYGAPEKSVIRTGPTVRDGFYVDEDGKVDFHHAATNAGQTAFSVANNSSLDSVSGIETIGDKTYWFSAYSNGQSTCSRAVGTNFIKLNSNTTGKTFATYYFKSGVLQKDCAFTVDGKTYIADLEGKVTEAKEGFVTINGRYRYMKADGTFMKDIFFRAQGTDGKEHTYYADSACNIQKGVFSCDSNGVLYFAGDDYEVITDRGDAAESSGKIVDTDTNDNILVEWEGKQYIIQKGGRVGVNTWINANLSYNGARYYQGSDGAIYRYGVYQIGSEYYYFYSDGALKFGQKSEAADVFTWEGNTYAVSNYYGDGRLWRRQLVTWGDHGYWFNSPAAYKVTVRNGGNYYFPDHDTGLIQFGAYTSGTVSLYDIGYPHRGYNNDKACLSKGNVYRIAFQNQYAFCCQGGQIFTHFQNCNYEWQAVDAQHRISAIAYLGFFSQDHSYKNYAYTQMAIWRYAVPKMHNSANGNMSFDAVAVDNDFRQNSDSWMDKLWAKLDKYEKLPSFDVKNLSKATDINVGETITLTDTNEVMNEYPTFTIEKSGLTIKHTSGVDSITVTAATNATPQNVEITNAESKSAGARRDASNGNSAYYYKAQKDNDIQNIFLNNGASVEKNLNLKFSIKSPNQAPTLTAPINNTSEGNHVANVNGEETIVVQLGNHFNPSLYQKADDKEDGDISAKTTAAIDAPLSTAGKATKAGKYKVHYTVTDSGGLSATKDVTMIVNDPPKVEVSDRYFFKGAKVTYDQIFEQVKASDTEDGEISFKNGGELVSCSTSALNADKSLNTKIGATYTFEVKVADSQGGVSEVKKFTVNVKAGHPLGFDDSKIRYIDKQSLDTIKQNSIWRLKEYHDELVASLDSNTPAESFTVSPGGSK